MKNTLKKLVAFSFLSIILSSFFSFATVNAAEPEIPADFGTPYGSPASIPYCIREDDSSKNNKITQIIEEPILQPSGNPLPKDPKFPNDPDCYGDENFQTCICYRNTFSFNVLDSKGKVKTRQISPQLLSQCSKTAQDLASDPKNEKYDARFNCQEVQVLFCNGGTCLITSYIGSIYRWAASIVGIIAVLVIIISAIQLSVAGGNQSAVDDAKRRILQSLGGIAVLFLSALILNTINPDFFRLS